MFSLASSLGAEGGDQYKSEVKPRTMSFDNDQNNLQAMQENASTMITAQLQRIQSTQKSADTSQDQISQTRKGLTSSPVSLGKGGSHQQKSEKSTGNVSDEDEFYECFDNEQDIKMLESNMNQDAPPSVTPIRRTASFTNIDKIVEAANDQEEEDQEEAVPKNKRQAAIDKFKLKQTKLVTNEDQGINPKLYLEAPNSIRNTYKDEEFFRVFT